MPGDHEGWSELKQEGLLESIAQAVVVGIDDGNWLRFRGLGRRTVQFNVEEKYDNKNEGAKTREGSHLLPLSLRSTKDSLRASQRERSGPGSVPYSQVTYE